MLSATASLLSGCLVPGSSGTLTSEDIQATPSTGGNPAPGQTGTPQPTPSPSPSAACNNPALTFCEDFDAGPSVLTSGGAIWSKYTGGTGATVTIDSTHAFSGNFAYHSHIPEGGGYSVITANIFPKGAVKSFWGRVMMYTTGAEPTGHSDYIIADSLLPSSAAYPPYMSGPDYSIANLNGSFGTNIKLGLAGNGSEYGTQFASKVTGGAWTCIEWYFSDTDAAAPVLSVYLNGSPTPLAGNSNIPKTGVFEFQTLTLGVTQFDAGTNAGGYDYWYDDVAASSTRIGCESGKGF